MHLPHRMDKSNLGYNGMFVSSEILRFPLVLLISKVIELMTVSPTPMLCSPALATISENLNAVHSNWNMLL